ncbi:MAG: MBL fold metallo-hydrolase [Chloroflexi bacterium]|nr:MBL fold metallo-hydrolase [Chloroflexota bacterium]
MVQNIAWRGQDTFVITGRFVIYTDPYQLKKDEPKAELILITHDHVDHCSPEDVAKIQKPGTAIVATAACASKLSGDIRVVKPGDKLEVKGVPIEAVPAYNLNKFRSPGVPFHPKEAGMVGYVFKANGLRFYHAGDIDNIPEIAGLAPDVAFIPVSGKYVMTVEEAVEAAKAINPKVAIPMHYGGTAGTPEDGNSFKAKATVPVVILKPE